MTDTANFRQRLAETLRLKEPDALIAFLTESGQWTAETVPADVEAMMWVMILGNAALTDLHDEADRWLTAHGRGADVTVLRQRGANSGGKPGVPGQRGHRPDGGSRHGGNG